ncbi:hypothetical protein C2S52_013237 [Perilla frutescens var. hirtella]|nr:hypothetical protein C2S52_013237 [Perilla frutescens var. hirtella]
MGVVEGALVSLEAALGKHNQQFAVILAKLESMGSGSGESSASRDGSGSSAQEGNNLGTHMSVQTPKIEFPTFDGSDPIAWLAQAEQYFLVHQTPLTDRVQIALIAMTRRSMFWAQWVLCRSATITWVQFTRELVERFGDSSATELRDQIPDSETTDVYAAIRAARRVVRSHKLTGVPPPRSTFSTGSFSRPTATYRSPSAPVAGKTQTGVATHSQFSSSALSVPRGNRGDSSAGEEEELEQTISPRDEHHEPKVNLQQLQLSRLSSDGFDGAQTLKLFSKVHGRQMLTMIDSGASHCFISDYLARLLELPIDSSADIAVVLGDGTRIRTRGVCKVVLFIISDRTFHITCYVFPLRSVDVILGVSWLAQLGDVVANWAKLTMQFEMAGETVVLRGDSSFTRRECMTTDRECFEQGDQAYLLWAMDNTTSSTMRVSLNDEVARKAALEALLTLFPSVTLPPKAVDRAPTRIESHSH